MAKFREILIQILGGVIDEKIAAIPAVTLTSEQLSEIASQIPPVDISGKVDKVTGSDLVPTTEIAKIHSNTLDHSNSLDHLNSLDHSNSLDHAAHSDDQDLSGLQPKETGKGLSVNDLTTALKTSYDSAVTHAGSSHAPATAQKNSDITKAEIEAKLTGVISTHSHSGGADPFLAKLVLIADKPTGANVTPVTLGLSFNYDANSQYVIDIYAIVAPTVATTGCGFMIDVSTVVTFVGTFVSHQLAATGTLSGAASAGDMAAASSGISSGMVIAGNNFVYGGGILVTGINAGTATFFFRSETTAVTTCKTGTIVRVMKI